MCGIAGILGNHPERKALFLKMIMKIKHRGEHCYQNEHHIHSQFVMGTNRLGIVDEGHGRQPFTYEDQVFCVMNGEIYNHAHLRKILGKRFSFDTLCDTEVVLKSYLYWGKDFLSKLDGMFAISIFDARTNSYLLARDPIGIKPLFYSEHKEAVFFSSELKSFCNISEVDTIRSLPPGTYIANGILDTYVAPPKLGSKSQSSRSAEDGICKTLTASIIKRCAPSEKRVACLLSGGVDSSIIVRLLKEQGYSAHAFTFSSPKNHSGDLENASKLCQELGVRHTLVSPDPGELKSFYLKFGVYLTESYETVLLRNAVSYHFVSQAVKDHGYKFLLNGEGADELFGGYDYFKQIPAKERDKEIEKALHNIHKTYLQMADRASMYATVEARVPYLDLDLIKFCANFPPHFRVKGNIDKWILRNFAKNILPRYIANRPKTGMNEGAGLGKNRAEEGLYYEAVRDFYHNNVDSYKRDFDYACSAQEKYKINLSDIEEIYNFCRFVDLGYDRLVDSNIRLQLNTPLIPDINQATQQSIRALS